MKLGNKFIIAPTFDLQWKHCLAKGLTSLILSPINQPTINFLLVENDQVIKFVMIIFWLNFDRTSVDFFRVWARVPMDLIEKAISLSINKWICCFYLLFIYYIMAEMIMLPFFSLVSVNSQSQRNLNEWREPTQWRFWI